MNCMKPQRLSLLLPVFLVVLAPSAAEPQERALTEIVREAKDAVVQLRSYDATGTYLGEGSGFMLPDGRIATNAHVVEGAVRVEIVNATGRLAGAVDHASTLSATVDLAILPALGGAATGLPLSSREPAVGETVIVIGSPQGLANTVSEGIVSAIREVRGRRLLQITAPISPGSSGGPVLNGQGRVIGVSVSQMRDGQNLNFAVPVGDLVALVSSPPGRMAFPTRREGAVTNATASVGDSAESELTAEDIIAALPALALDSVYAGSLTRSDFETTDGTYTDFYRFDGSAGSTVTILIESDAFDTYLELGYVPAGGEWTNIAEDDDGASGTNSMIVQRLPASAPYALVVRSYRAGETGDYEVAVLDGDFSAEVRSYGGTPRGTGRWTVVGETDDFTVYLDRSSVRQNYGSIYEGWVRYDYYSTQRLSDGEAYTYTVDLQEVDCRRRMGRTLEVTYYRREGESVDSRNWRQLTDKNSWRPGSIGESIGEAICPAGGA